MAGPARGDPSGTYEQAAPEKKLDCHQFARERRKASNAGVQKHVVGNAELGRGLASRRGPLRAGKQTFPVLLLQLNVVLDQSRWVMTDALGYASASVTHLLNGRITRQGRLSHPFLRAAPVA